LELQGRLRVLARQLLAFQDSQRRELSLELTALLTEQLAPIISQLGDLKTQAGANLRVLHHRISTMQGVIDQAAANMQYSAWNLHPSVLDDLGLIPALVTLHKTQAIERGNHFDLSISPNLASADGPMRNAFYCIARETMTGADLSPSAQILLTDVPGGLSMVVKFTQSSTSASCKRLSILGMGERVKMAGGKFWSTKRSGESMVLRIEIPFLVIPPAQSDLPIKR